MGKHFILGFGYGIVYGLIYAWIDTLSLFILTRTVMHIVWDPFTDATFYLASWMVLLCSLLGGMLMAAVGTWILKDPVRFNHAMAASLTVMVLATTTGLAPLGLSLAGVGGSHLLSILFLRVFRQNRRIFGACVPTMAAAWVLTLRFGVPANTDTRPETARVGAPAGLPNVLWVIFDTTRADHIPLYGYARDTTPTLSRLAQDGVVFDQAYSTACWTLEAHASMFTGKFASQHWCNHEHMFLDPQNTTLATLLKDAGYDTAVFAGNPWLEHTVGTVRGFDQVVASWRHFTLYNLSFVGRLRVMGITGGQDKGAIASNAAFKDWYEKRTDSQRPFFAFINYLEAHAPYHDVPVEDRRRFLPPHIKESDAVNASHKFMERMVVANNYNATELEREAVIALYDGGIYNADRRLGEVLDFLKQKGTLDNTLVIVASDHGELFGEHDIYGHDLALYHPVVHVPLVMRFPARIPANTRIKSPVQLIDVFPSVLELTRPDLEIPREVRGKSIWPLFGADTDLNRPVFAEFFTPAMPPLIREIERMGMDASKFRMKSVQVKDIRLIRWIGYAEKMFDISVDKNEERDLVEERSAEAQMLRNLLDRFTQENAPSSDISLQPVPEMDEAAKEKLRSLGYIQ